MRPQRVALSLAFVLAVAVTARAETYLTPFAGASFAGNTDDSKLTYGGDLAFAGSGIFGLSVEFGYTKDFFGGTPSFVDNNVATLMGNIMLISPGRARLYVSGGPGLLKTRVKDAGGFFDVDSTDFGVNVGGGIYVVGGGALGFRADVRYFRALSDLEPDGEFDLDLGDLDFWRATAGITIKF